MLAVGKGPPAPFSESWHWDWLSWEGQPANGGSFLRSCGWRRQSSEVLYVTYQHGLPFNQRVERKDKVKPSSLGSANQKDFTTKPCKGRQESETRKRFAIKTNCSIRKRGGRVKMEWGNVAVRPGQKSCWVPFKVVLKNTRGTISLIRQVLFPHIDLFKVPGRLIKCSSGNSTFWN